MKDAVDNKLATSNQTDLEKNSQIEETIFLTNMVRNDLKILKQYLKTMKIDEITNIIKKQDHYQHQICNLKDELTRAVKVTDLEYIQKQFDNYTRLEEFRFLENELKMMASQDDFENANHRMDGIEKKQSYFIKSDEFMYRLCTFQQEFQKHLNIRPTEKTVNQLHEKLED